MHSSDRRPSDMLSNVLPEAEVSTPENEAFDASQHGSSFLFLRQLAHVPSHALATVSGPAEAPVFESDALSQRFEPRSLLGRGGFGVVYEVFDRVHRAAVALKIMRRSDAGSIYLFKQEFRALAELVHPNLVRLYELGSDGSAWWFSMELVRGVDAGSYVKTSVGQALPFEEPRLRSLLRELVDGLCFLHSAGKLHRDVKPSNVLVTEGGRVVLLDFGLVAQIEDALAAAEVAGTPHYMAPEQADRTPVGPSADLYAVGVMLYEMLTGKLPFEGEFDLLLERKKAGAIVAPSALVPGVPLDLERLCMDLLAPDPSLRPSGREVSERLVAEAGAPLSRHREAPQRRDAALIGRQQELSQLDLALAATCSGKTVVALVHGHSGAGKSALLARFIERLEDREDPRPLVLSGRCFEQESMPYKTLDSLVDALCRRLKHEAPEEVKAVLPHDVATLARLFPALLQLPEVRQAPRPEASASVFDLRRRAFGALRELCARAGRRRPLVLVLDDLQWGDLDGIGLLVEILRPPDPPPLLFVTAYREGEEHTSPAVAALRASLEDARAGGVEVRQVKVDELDPAASEELVRALLSGEPSVSARAAKIAAMSRGNPFFITEICCAEPEEGTLDFALSHAGTGSGTDDLDALVLARVEHLPTPARRLLSVVALAGQPIGRAVAFCAAFREDLNTEELNALSVLRSGRLLRVRSTGGGEELLPYHDRIREPLVAHLSPEDRAHYHHRIAVTLLASGQGESEQLVVHFRAAGLPLDAARYAVLAAARAYEAFAFDRAARLYREAIELGAFDAAKCGELHGRRADALAAAGRLQEATDAYLCAAEGAHPDAALEWRRSAMEMLFASGSFEQGDAVLSLILREIGIEPRATVIGSLLSVAEGRMWLAARGLGFRERAASEIARQDRLHIDACWAAAIGYTVVGDPIRNLDYQTRHLLLTLKTGEPMRVARALGAEAMLSALYEGKNRAKTDRMLSKAATLADRVGDPQMIATLSLLMGHIALLRGEFRRSRALFQRSLSLYQDNPRMSWSRAMAGTALAYTSYLVGEIKESSDLTSALRQDLEERGSRVSRNFLDLIVSPLVYLAADEPERAEAAIRSVTAIDAKPKGKRKRMAPLNQYRACVMRARVALYTGRGLDAYQLMTAQERTLRRVGMLQVQAIRADCSCLRALGAIAAADQGKTARLSTVLEEAASIADLQTTRTDALAAILRAAVAQRQGRDLEAIELLNVAEAGFASIGMKLHEMATRRRRGQCMGGDAGQELVAGAEAWMTGQTIRNPERITAMMMGERAGRR